MRLCRLLVRTLREIPSDAEVPSHRLLLRGGFIRPVSPGVHDYLPLGLRVLQKIERIVREEMDAAGAQELRTPILCPAELWRESGRPEASDEELFRLRNRHERDEILCPDHLVVVTALARDELRSYRQLPINLYQIRSAFRDVARPRYGLLREREFMMKEACSFHDSAPSLDETCDRMARAYRRIFERCGLRAMAVEAYAGLSGGNLADALMVLVDSQAGEVPILSCDTCAYAATSERARGRSPGVPAEPRRERHKVPTPGIRTVSEQAAMLGIPKERIVKTFVAFAEYPGESRSLPLVALVRGDAQVNLAKLAHHLGCDEIRPATDEEVLALTGVKPGFVGPFTLPAGLRVVADEALRDLTNFSTGAGEIDMHWVDANWDERFTPGEWADIRQAEAGERCARCETGTLMASRGIELGKVCKLGTRLSRAMGATFAAPDGSEHPFEMGRYALGITRTAQAVVEVHHDEHGIKWPIAVAPYHLVIIPATLQDPDLRQAAEDLYGRLNAAGVEAVLDDREDRIGVKFKDADLIGFPLRITVGKALKDGKVELKIRATGELREVPLAEVVERACDLVKGAVAASQGLRVRLPSA